MLFVLALTTTDAVVYLEGRVKEMFILSFKLGG